MNIKKIIALSLTGLLAWAFFMVINLPAAFVYQLAPVPNNVAVNNITGTIWSGQAGEATINGIALNNINWDIQPAALLRQNLQADISLGDLQSPVSAQASVTASRSGVMVSDATIDVAAEWLQTMVPIPDFVIVDVTGNLNLNVRGMNLTQQGCQSLDGQLLLERSHLESPFGNIRLGDASADLSCNQGQLTAQVSQSSDDISTDGQLNLYPNQRFDISATLVPGDEMPEQLAQGLDFVAESNSDNSYSINLSGRL